MPNNIVTHFTDMQLRDISLSAYVPTHTGSAIQDTVSAMADADTSCAFVMAGNDVVGVVTEHDVALHVVAQPDVWDQPIEQIMTPDPFTVGADSTAIHALTLMNTRRFRNLPVIDDSVVAGNLTQYDLIRLASSYFRTQRLNDDQASETSLLFVNFTGLLLGQPVTFTPDANLAFVIDTMIQEGTGLAAIVNDRGVVIGEFTEHDIFTKVACKVTDLAAEVVGDWMTHEFAGTSPRTTIAAGIDIMAEIGHRYLVMLSETGHATGIATFGDIAAYFEAAFSV